MWPMVFNTKAAEVCLHTKILNSVISRVSDFSIRRINRAGYVITVPLGYLNANDDGLQGPPGYDEANHRAAEMPEGNNANGGLPSYAEAMAGREEEVTGSGERNTGSEPNVNDSGAPHVRDAGSSGGEHDSEAARSDAQH